VPREQLERGAEELGVEMNEHIQVVIDALSEKADELGLAPREGAAADAE
jgi:predicted hydrolase (HD superfamily)